MNFCSIKKLREGGVTFLNKAKYLETLLINAALEEITVLTVFTTADLAAELSNRKPELLTELQLEIAEDPKRAFFELVQASYDKRLDYEVKLIDYPQALFFGDEIHKIRQ
jgi:hypothetical protein